MNGARGRLTLLAMLALAALCLSAANGRAEAASHACQRLEAQLAAAGNGGGPALIRKYDDAIFRQEEQIARGRDRMRRAGCGFSVSGRNLSQCAGLSAAMDRMTANLDMLERKRARLAAGAGSRRERARIMAALDANGCNDEPVAAPDEALRGADDLPAGRPRDPEEADIFPDGRRDEGRYEQRASGIIKLAPPRPDPNAERFRTMCVRSCDGYFFPMSNAATLSDFERDGKNCRSACPGTEMQVFYTPGLGDDAGGMISAANGRPYRELGTAYLYKRAGIPRPPGCGCNTASGFEIVAGNRQGNGEPLSGAQAGSSFVRLPSITPPTEPTAKTAAQSPVAEEAAPVERELPADRKVRVVGPAFLPDPSAAIDLQAPAPTTGR